MKQNIKNILVATDFSDTGNNAVMTAVRICKQQNAVLHLLHVVDNRYIVSVSDTAANAASKMSEIDHEARNQLYNIYETILRTYGIPVQLQMPTGIPFDEICKAASEIEVDLVVMGTKGIAGLKDFAAGTITHVIRNCTRPVLTVPAEFTADAFNKILFPFRPLYGGKEKYEFAQAFFTKGTSLHVAVLCNHGEERFLMEYKDELSEIVTSKSNAGISCTCEMYTSDNLADKVLELSEKLNSNLIMITATLEHRGGQFFVGSYLKQIISRAKIPVLSFRRAKGLTEDLQGQNIMAQKVISPHAGL